MENKPFKTRILLWFVFLLAILGGITATVAASFIEVQKQQQAIEHTYEVIAQLEETSSSIKDVQVAQRGFVITGRDEYLSPYFFALPKIEAGLKALDRLLAANPEQKQRLVLLNSRANARLDRAAHIIETYRDKGEAAAFALVREGTGNREMEEIRALVQDMVTYEHNTLVERRNMTDTAMLLTLRAGVMGFLICASIIGLILWIVQREMTQRAQTQATLQSTITEMETLSRESQLLNKLGDFLQSCQSLKEAFTTLSRHITPLLPDTSGALILLSDSEDSLQKVAEWGETQTSETDFEPEECWGMRRGTAHYVTPEGTEPVCSHVQRVEAGGSLCIPMQALGETIGIFYVSSDNAATLGDRKRVIAHTLSEQTALAIANLRLQEKLRDQSIRDPLTQLYNRRYLQETLDREFSRSRRNKQPVSVLILDLDHFKKFNDTFGHDAGDSLLVHFAKLLSAHVRREDIVCRYGGEEFVLVMPTTDIENATARANLICEATRKMKVNLDGKNIGQVTVSIGYGTFPNHGDLPEQVISAADAALYQAKQGGRDRAVLAKS